MACRTLFGSVSLVATLLLALAQQGSTQGTPGTGPGTQPGTPTDGPIPVEIVPLSLHAGGLVAIKGDIPFSGPNIKRYLYVFMHTGSQEVLGRLVVELLHEVHGMALMQVPTDDSVLRAINERLPVQMRIERGDTVIAEGSRTNVVRPSRPVEHVLQSGDAVESFFDVYYQFVDRAATPQEKRLAHMEGHAILFKARRAELEALLQIYRSTPGEYAQAMRVWLEMEIRLHDALHRRLQR